MCKKGTCLNCENCEELKRLEEQQDWQEYHDLFAFKDDLTPLFEEEEGEE